MPKNKMVTISVTIDKLSYAELLQHENVSAFIRSIIQSVIRLRGLVAERDKLNAENKKIIDDNGGCWDYDWKRKPSLLTDNDGVPIPIKMPGYEAQKAEGEAILFTLKPAILRSKELGAQIERELHKVGTVDEDLDF
jgi:hypothetical protein